MPNIVVKLNNSQVIISVSQDPYSLGLAVFMVGKDNKYYEELTKIGLPITQVGHVLNIFGWDNILKALQHMLRNNLCHQNDKADLAVFIKEIEKIVAQHKALSSTMSPGQVNIFLGVAELYLEIIIDNAPNEEVATQLLRFSLSVEANRSSQQTLQFIAEQKFDNSMQEAVIELSKLCCGQANFESTFTRMDTKLPDQKQQKLVLTEEFFKRVKKKYADLNDEKNFCIILSLLLFCHEEQTLKPLGSAANIAVQALASDAKDMNSILNQNFVWGGNPHLLLKKAIALLDINIEKPEGLARLTALQQVYRSKHLQNFITDMHALVPESIALLRQGFKAKQPNMIKQALSNIQDVNKPIQNGGNALHVALAMGDMVIVNAVLSFNPDVNRAVSAENILKPLGMAVRKFNPEQVQILLQRGANVFLCSMPDADVDMNDAARLAELEASLYANRFSPEILANPQQLILKMGQMAIQHNLLKPGLPIKGIVKQLKLISMQMQTGMIKNQQIDISLGKIKEIFKLLLLYGAGVGQHFDISLEIGLKKIVMIGGSCSHKPKPDTILILTAADFIEHVKHGEYPHWLKVFTQAFESKDFNKSAKLQIELELLVLHIKNVITAENIVDDAKSVDAKFAARNAGVDDPTASAAAGGSAAAGSGGAKTPNSSAHFGSGSPVTAADDKQHKALLDTITPLLNVHPSFKFFQKAITERNYGKALRIACTSTHADAFTLIEILCKQKFINATHINERAGAKQENALHVAARYGNQRAYDFLVTQPDVNADLTNSSGKTALALLAAQTPTAEQKSQNCFKRICVIM